MTDDQPSPLGAMTEGAKLLQMILATKTVSAMDGILGDRLGLWRLKQGLKLAERAKALLEARNLDSRPVVPSIGVPLLDAGSLADDPDMQERWATLLASAAHPIGGGAVPPSFPRILAEVSPYEAKLLDRTFQRAVEIRCNTHGILRGYDRLEEDHAIGGYHATEHLVDWVMYSDDLTDVDVSPWLGEIGAPHPAALANLCRLMLLTVPMVGTTRSGKTGVWVDFRDRDRQMRFTPLGQDFVRACLSEQQAAEVRLNV